MRRSVSFAELAIILAILATIAFWIWMLIECATQEPANNDKIVWIIIIALLQFIGVLIYFIVRRPQRISLIKRS
jgi:heme/copper-type cytochrome/quinol oxidase subunit 4